MINLLQKQISYHIKLGIFICLGLTLLLVAVFFIGEARNMFSKTFLVSAVFRDVNGLQVGNNVWFGGIHVGTIASIQMITDSSVQVEMIVEEKSRKFIAKDSKAIIGSDGLMGNKILIISPGTASSERIKNGDQMGSQMPINMDDIMHQLAATTMNAALITDDMAAITGNIRYGKGTIGKLFMDTSFAENLDRTLLNVRRGSQGFKDNMDAAKKSIFLRGAFKKDKKKD